MTEWDRVPGEKGGWGRQGYCRTWAPSSPPANLALAHICSLGLSKSKRTSHETAQSIFPEPPQATSEGHHFWQSEQTQTH